MTDLQKRQKNYLLFTAFIIGSFGPIFMLGSTNKTATAANFTLDLLDFPLDGAQTLSTPTSHFLSAHTGGFLFGWGITILGLRQWVFDSNPDGVRKAIVTGIIAWCCLDSLGSVLAGATSNVLFNLAVLTAAIGPLWKKSN